MEEPTRFTLRKEYFGGIVHDTKKMDCVLLSHKVHDILWNMVACDHFDAAMASSSIRHLSRQDQKTIQTLLERGALSKRSEIDYRCHDIRGVWAKIIPDGCLTAPLRIYDTYTRRCNLKCPQCCVAANADFKEDRRTTEETKLIMRKFFDAGTMEWRFTGGEPTCAEDFLEAVTYAKSLNMAIMLNTNGCWDDRLYEQIPGSGIREVIFSFEGSDETMIHRRGEGVHANVLRAIDTIQVYNRLHPDEKIGIVLNMTIARDNVHELEYVVRLAAQKACTVNFLPLRPYGRTPASCLSDAMLSTEEFRDFSENVQRMRGDPQIKESGIRIVHRNMDLFCPEYPDRSGLPAPFNYASCGALSFGFGLGPDGCVNACSFMMYDPMYVGPNMITSSVQEAWLHENMEHFRRAMRVGCGGCQFYMKQCGGKCHAMVLAEGGEIRNGRLIGKDRYCIRGLMPHEKTS